jgi:hypothetical protein
MRRKDSKKKHLSKLYSWRAAYESCENAQLCEWRFVFPRKTAAWQASSADTESFREPEWPNISFKRWSR